MPIELLVAPGETAPSAQQSVSAVKAMLSLIAYANQELSTADFRQLQLDSQRIFELSQQLQLLLRTQLSADLPLNLVAKTEASILPGAPPTKLPAENLPMITMFAAESDAMYKSRQKMVLVAEDNPVNQKVALWQLRELGFAVDIAVNGNDVVRAALSNKYAVIFMDCDMPMQNGFDATRAIRANEKGSDRRTPIVAMTAQATEADKRRCFSVGMDDYLTKPVRQADLQRVLAAVAPDLANVRHEPLAFEMLEQNLGKETALEILEVYARATAELVVDLEEAICQCDSKATSAALKELSSSCTVVGASGVVQQCGRLLEHLQNADWQQLENGMAELIRETRTVGQYVVELLSNSADSHI